MSEILKVTDPQRQVTDPVLLSSLAKAGIDSSFVEFYQDYAMPIAGEKGKSPYAKFYRDLKSSKRFAVISGLPMVNADGTKIEVGWRVADINYFAEKNNLFRAKVQGTQVEVTIRNDQPDGRKANDKISFQPQLYLNNIEQVCSRATLLPIDPVNPNYTNNTLEWDYSICKRRLRIIEGKILGSWVFASNPGGVIRIRYNQSGDYKLRLGQFKIDNDTEVIPKDVFDNPSKYGFPQGYPLSISDSATFYPDAHAETTSVDGYAAHFSANDTWANIHDGAGTEASDSEYTDCKAYIASYDIAWYFIHRTFMLFDTSSLPDTAVISDATFSGYGRNKWNTFTSANPVVNIYSSAPATNTAIVAGDYDSLGVTAFCDTPITYANWKITSPFWNDFVLNATGKAAIDKTGVTKLGFREVTYDVANQSPAWEINKNFFIAFYASEQGAGYKPKLVVTYSTAIDYPIATATNLAMSATVGRAIAFNRVVSTGLSIAASIVRVFGRSIATATNLAVSATISRVAAFGRATSSTLAISVTVSRVAAYIRAISTANLSLSTSISRVLAVIRASSSSISVSTSVVMGWGRTVVTSTNLAVSTSVSRIVDYIRDISSNLSVAVTVTRALAVSITLSVNLAVSTSVSRVVDYARDVATSLSIATSVSRIFSAVRATSTVLSAATLVTRVFGGVRTVSTALSVRTSIVYSFFSPLIQKVRMKIVMMTKSKMNVIVKGGGSHG